MMPDKHKTSKLRRFFSPFPIKEAVDLVLPQSETEHLQRVLRMTAGDHCLIADATGVQAEAKIKAFNLRHEAVLEIVKILPPLQEPLTDYFFYVSLPQKGKFDWMLEKAQELGVDAIIPLITQRTVVHLGEKKDKVFSRWQRILQEASKQSGARPAKLYEPLELKNALKVPANNRHRVFFHPGPYESLGSWFHHRPPGPCEFYFGPEGGFSDEEIALARQSGAIILSLGPRILKVDTAFLAAAAYLNFAD